MKPEHMLGLIFVFEDRLQKIFKKFVISSLTGFLRRIIISTRERNLLEAARAKALAKYNQTSVSEGKHETSEANLEEHRASEGVIS